MPSRNEPVSIPVSGSTRDPALALLRGGAVPSSVIGTVVLIVGVLAGRSEFLGALVGVVLASVAMSVGPLVMRTVRRRSGPAVLAASVLAYGVVVTFLGALFLIIAPQRWLSSSYVAAGLIAVGATWAVGETWAAARLRITAFGDGSSVS
jgi:fucose 4-O-acetylase-like acetyltransferase